MKSRAFGLYTRRERGGSPMPPAAAVGAVGATGRPAGPPSTSKPVPLQLEQQSSEVYGAPSDSPRPGEYDYRRARPPPQLLLDQFDDGSNEPNVRHVAIDNDGNGSRAPPPQLPPPMPISPISPRWDSFSNNFVYQNSAGVQENSKPYSSEDTLSPRVNSPFLSAADSGWLGSSSYGSETSGQNSGIVADAAGGVRGLDNSKQSYPGTPENRASVSTSTITTSTTTATHEEVIAQRRLLEEAARRAADVAQQDSPTVPNYREEFYRGTTSRSTTRESPVPTSEHEIAAHMHRTISPTPSQHSRNQGQGGLDSEMMSVGNFSRPRRPSLKQPTPADPANQYHVLVQQEQQEQQQQQQQQQSYLPDNSYDDASLKFAWPRARGTSVSSAKSLAVVTNATYAFPAPPLSAGIYDSRAGRQYPQHSARHAPAPLDLSRPSPAYAKVNSSTSGNPRDGSGWLGEESRSSVRSQTTMSTAHLTYTERNSVLTKGTSITSIYGTMDPNEPSVEDVMGLYEKGFGDDSDDEETDLRQAEQQEQQQQQQSRPQSATSVYSLREASMPLQPRTSTGTATAIPIPIRGPPKSPSDDDLPAFDARPLSMSVPKDLAFGAMPRKSSENRDSAKSMGDYDESMTEGKASSTLKHSSIPSELEDPDARDRYGFKKANQYITRERYDDWNEGYSKYLERRKKKWMAFMKENSLPTHEPNRFPPPSTKTKRFVRKGIPPEWRGAAWFYYAHGPHIMGQHAGVYDDMVNMKAKEADAEAIEKDLDRTFPDNVKFRPAGDYDPHQYKEGGINSPAEPELISSLRRVLHAFSIYNPNIGYCQSLNFIAGLLLLFVETEEQAFWLLNVITRSFLPGTHDRSLEGSQIDLSVLMKVLHESMPQLWLKLTGADGGDAPGTRPSTARSLKKSRSRKKPVPPLSSTDRLPPITLTMTAWFMSCFIGTLPIETVLRVWDVFFYENSKTMFRIALAILKQGEDEIHGVSDPMEMFSVVQTMPRRMLDANELLEACFKRRNGFGHLSQATVDQERKERKEKAEAERRRIANGGVDGEVRRKGTLFGRKKKRSVTTEDM